MFAARAGAVAGAGAAMLLIAFLFDAAPLFVPAVALMLVGLAMPAWVWISARGALARRDLRADRVIEGDPLAATIVVRRGPLGLPGAEVVDPFTSSRLELSGPLSPFEGSREAHVRVVTRFPRRGLHTLSPPVLHVRDPLELARVETTSDAPAQTLLVLPRTEAVRWLSTGRGRRFDLLDGESAAETLAAVDLDGLRPYRPGTPASRIHWPALARGAGLIERRLQADGDTRPLVVLDARGPGPEEDLDAAVRAAASLTLEFARSGGCGLLLPGEQRATSIDRELMNWPAAYARLAMVASGPDTRVPAVGAPRGRLGPMIYVAARAPERLSRGAELGGGGVVLVVPRTSLSGGRPQGLRGSAVATLEVSGCRGFLLGARREPKRPQAREVSSA
ncbi:MAG TPA: DUF58 domain-containing protein [Solirubrobacteraceae bacterium]